MSLTQLMPNVATPSRWLWHATSRHLVSRPLLILDRYSYSTVTSREGKLREGERLEAEHRQEGLELWDEALEHEDESERVRDEAELDKVGGA